MRLAALESRCHRTDGLSVLGERILHRVDTARTRKRCPGGAEKKVGGSGKARHDDCSAKKRLTEKEGRGTRWIEGTTPGDKLSFATNPKNLGGVLSHRLTNQQRRIADVPGVPGRAEAYLDKCIWAVLSHIFAR